MGKRIGTESKWMVDGDERAGILRADAQVAAANSADTLHDVDQALRSQGVNLLDVAPAVGRVSFDDVLATIDAGLSASQGEQQ